MQILQGYLHIVRPNLLQVYMESDRKQPLCASFIPKTGNPQLITCWMPIFLLNVSYKLLAKSLAISLRLFIQKMFCLKLFIQKITLLEFKIHKFLNTFQSEKLLLSPEAQREKWYPNPDWDSGWDFLHVIKTDGPSVQIQPTCTSELGIPSGILVFLLPKRKLKNLLQYKR